MTRSCYLPHLERNEVAPTMVGAHFLMLGRKISWLGARGAWRTPGARSVVQKMSFLTYGVALMPPHAAEDPPHKHTLATVGATNASYLSVIEALPI